MQIAVSPASSVTSRNSSPCTPRMRSLISFLLRRMRDRILSILRNWARATAPVSSLMRKFTPKKISPWNSGGANLSLRQQAATSW